MQELTLIDAISQIEDIDSLKLKHSSFGDEELWSQFVSSLNANKSLKSIDFQMIYPTATQLDELCFILNENKTITNLNLSFNKLGDSGAKNIGDVLKNNSNIIELNIACNSIGSNGAQYLCDSLLVNSSLNIFNIQKNELKSYGASLFSEVLKFNSSLKVLDLGDNNIEDAGIESLSEGLKKNNSLTTLSIAKNNIGLNGVIQLSLALKSNITLTKLILKENKIKEKGVQELCKLLQTNSTLTLLDIESNNIGIKGAESISKMLKLNSSLTTLYLGNNNLLNEGAKYLAESLKFNNTLSILHLQKNGIGDEGVISLSESLKINSSLSELKLSGNFIGDKGSKSISEMLKFNKRLISFDLEGNQIGENGVQSLSEGLKSNISLTSLSLKWNIGYDKRIFNDLIEDYLNRNQFLSSSYNSIILDYLTNTQNVINSVRNELISWKSEVLNQTRTNSDSPQIIYSKQILSKIQNIRMNYPLLLEIKKILLSTISTIEDIENYDDFAFEIEKWIESREESLKIINDIKQKREEQTIIEDSLETNELSYLLAAKKKNDEEAYSLINTIDNEKNILKKLKSENRNSILQVNKLGHRDLINELFKSEIGELNLKPNIIERESIINLVLKIKESGKLFKRKLKNYSIYSLHSNTIFATNIEEEKVVLKKYNLSTKYNIERALDEFSSLIKYQNRSFSIPINGAFIEEIGNEFYLIIETQEFGVGNLLHWIKNINSDRNQPYNGIPLRKYEVKRDFRLILKVLYHIVESVSDLHSLGIEHRNLTPENILVDSQGNVKLLNYQIVIDDNYLFSQSYNTFKGYSSSLIYRYAPPERKKFRNSSSFKFGSWDIYSLGIIFYEILCDIKDQILIDNIGTDTNLSSILIQSGYLSNNEWLFKSIISMTNFDPSSRISSYNLARVIQDSTLESKDDYIQICCSKPIQELIALIQQSNNLINRVDVIIPRDQLINTFTKIMNDISTREEISKNINIKILEDKVGTNFRDLLNEYIETLFKQDRNYNNPIFEYQEAFYTPTDEKELKNEMEAFGRLIFHCIIKGYTLHMQLSPWIYCIFNNRTNILTSDISEMLSLLRRFDPQAVAFIEQNLNHFNENNREVAQNILSKKKNQLIGSKYRLKNMEHIYNGFTYFMKDEEKLLLKNSSWDELELLCCGPEVITSEQLLYCMKESLSSWKWDVSELTKQTKEWLIYWIENQNSFGLRKFLQYGTGLTYIPSNLNYFQLKVLPRDQYIRSITCLQKIKIGTSCPTKKEFFVMIKNEIESIGY